MCMLSIYLQLGYSNWWPFEEIMGRLSKHLGVYLV